MSSFAAIRTCVVLIVLVAGLPRAADAQGESTPPPPPAAPVPASQPDPDQQFQPAEPDFTLGALPTTLRVPSRKAVFRMTHRFTRAIASGDAGDFFADFFGFDSSARIGLELRYGLLPGTQAGIHRTNTRAIQFFGQQDLWRSAGGVGVQALAAIEGADNFSEDFSGTIGAIVSKRFATRGAIYVEPMGVFNSNPKDPPLIDPLPPQTEDHTFLVGVGGRWRLGGTVYVFAEGAPRLKGHDPGVNHVSVGVEKRAGGHVFQLNISNALGTTYRQIAQGGLTNDDWYIGFNLTRRFF